MKKALFINLIPLSLLAGIGLSWLINLILSKGFNVITILIIGLFLGIVILFTEARVLKQIITEKDKSG